MLSVESPNKNFKDELSSTSPGNSPQVAAESDNECGSLSETKKKMPAFSRINYKT
jgi:hypothetical protein